MNLWMFSFGILLMAFATQLNIRGKIPCNRYSMGSFLILVISGMAIMWGCTHG